MSLTKYAEFEVIAVEQPRVGALGRVEAVLTSVEGAARTAHRAVFDYEPRPGYVYVRSRAISSRCNDNYDEFPAEEIKKAYRTFVGKPVFVNHHNANHRTSRGVCIDAALHEDLNPDGSPDTWVEVLHEVDAVKFPKLAQAVLSGDIARTSMGTDVAYSICTACGNKAVTPADYCQHIPKMKGMRISRTTASGERHEIVIAERCYGLAFFEDSLLVEPPADPTAWVLGAESGDGLQVAASRQTNNPFKAQPPALYMDAGACEDCHHSMNRHWSDGEAITCLACPCRVPVQAPVLHAQSSVDEPEPKRCTCGALDFDGCFCDLTMAEWIADRRAKGKDVGRLSARTAMPAPKDPCWGSGQDVALSSSQISGSGLHYDAVCSTCGREFSVRVKYDEDGWPSIRLPNHSAPKTANKTADWDHTPAAAKAHHELNNAIRDGKVKKPGSCQKCKKQPGSENIHGHHHKGYSNGLDVQWLCTSCHSKAHSKKSSLHSEAVGPNFWNDGAQIVWRQDHEDGEHAGRPQIGCRLCYPLDDTQKAQIEKIYDTLAEVRTNEPGLYDRAMRSSSSLDEFEEAEQILARRESMMCSACNPNSGLHEGLLCSSHAGLAKRRHQWGPDAHSQTQFQGRHPDETFFPSMASTERGSRMAAGEGAWGLYVTHKSGGHANVLPGARFADRDEAVRAARLYGGDFRGNAQISGVAVKQYPGSIPTTTFEEFGKDPSSFAKTGISRTSIADWMLPEGYVFIRLDSGRAYDNFKRHVLEPGETIYTLVSFTKPAIYAVPRAAWDRVQAMAAAGGNISRGMSLIKRPPNLEDYRRPIGGDFETTGSRHVHSYGEQRAPADVDTLRAESCPVCGDDEAFNGDRCAVCGFMLPPSQFRDPDLSKAKEVDLRQEQGEDVPGGSETQPPGPSGDVKAPSLRCDQCGVEFPDSRANPARQTAPEAGGAGGVPTTTQPSGGPDDNEPPPAAPGGADKKKAPEDEDEDPDDPKAKKKKPKPGANPFAKGSVAHRRWAAGAPPQFGQRPDEDGDRAQDPEGTGGQPGPAGQEQDLKAGDQCPNCGQGTLSEVPVGNPQESLAGPVEPAQQQGQQPGQVPGQSEPPVRPDGVVDPGQEPEEGAEPEDNDEDKPEDTDAEPEDGEEKDLPPWMRKKKKDPAAEKTALGFGHDGRGGSGTGPGYWLPPVAGASASQWVSLESGAPEGLREGAWSDPAWMAGGPRVDPGMSPQALRESGSSGSRHAAGEHSPSHGSPDRDAWRGGQVRQGSPVYGGEHAAPERRWASVQGVPADLSPEAQAEDRSLISRRQSARGIEGTGVDAMPNPNQNRQPNPAQAQRNRIIASLDSQQRRLLRAEASNTYLAGVLRDLVRAAGVNINQPRFAGLRALAADENADEVAKTDEQALAPAAKDSPENVGAAPAPANTGVTPDATTDVQNDNVALPNEPFNKLEDVTKPEGEQTPPKGDAAHVETEVRVTAPSNDVAFKETGWTASKGDPQERLMEALRLARLRIASGIERGEDVVIAQAIVESATPLDVLRYEVATLERVASAAPQRTASVGETNGQPPPRRLVPQAAGQRSRPSIASVAAQQQTTAAAEDPSRGDEWGIGDVDPEA